MKHLRSQFLEQFATHIIKERLIKILSKEATKEVKEAIKAFTKAFINTLLKETTQSKLRDLIADIEQKKKRQKKSRKVYQVLKLAINDGVFAMIDSFLNFGAKKVGRKFGKGGILFKKYNTAARKFAEDVTAGFIDRVSFAAVREVISAVKSMIEEYLQTLGNKKKARDVLYKKMENPDVLKVVLDIVWTPFRSAVEEVANEMYKDTSF